jgi:hypothetical protein
LALTKVWSEEAASVEPDKPASGGLFCCLEDPMDELTKTVIERGDLAHLALFLWASGASALLMWSLREMARVNQHFNDFVQEIAQLNRLFRKED